jgi:hypothetical protein
MKQIFILILCVGFSSAISAETLNCEAQQFVTSLGWVPKAVEIEISGNSAIVSSTEGRHAADGRFEKQGNKFVRTVERLRTKSGSYFDIAYSVRVNKTNRKKIYFGYELLGTRQNGGLTMKCTRINS